MRETVFTFPFIFRSSAPASKCFAVPARTGSVVSFLVFSAKIFDLSLKFSIFADGGRYLIPKNEGV